MYSGRAMCVFTVSLATVTVGAAYNALDEYEQLIAALYDTAERHMELCRRNVEDGVDYSYGDDMLLAGVAREVMLMCWDVIDHDLWQTVGASVARDGQRMARIFRDMAVAAAHRNTQLRDMWFGESGRASLGEPRIPLGS